MKFKVFYYKIFQSSRRVAKRPYRIEDIPNIFEKVPSETVVINIHGDFKKELLKDPKKAISYYLRKEMITLFIRCGHNDDLDNSISIMSASASSHKYALRCNCFFIAANEY